MNIHERPPMPRVLHFVLNTACNAWDLRSVPGSPGVCRFCYRERESVRTTPETITRLLEMIRREPDIRRIVVTGGDPLMPKENHVAHALRCAKQLGFETNIHTNGLLLREKHTTIGEWIDVITLAIDGADSDTADWERGAGYFECFKANVRLLTSLEKTLAFNTFVSPRNFPRIEEVGRMIHSFSQATRVEYWLLSQYRPIARDTATKRSLYGFSPADFKASVEKLAKLWPSLNIYAQPTRENDLYPMRIWLLADGVLTMDTGLPGLARNVVVGNCFEEGFAPLYRRALTMRSGRSGASAQVNEAPNAP